MPYCGIALWKYKQGHFQEWLEIIDTAIHNELQAKPEALSYGILDNPILWYVKIAAWKKLHYYELAEKEYGTLLPYIKKKEGQQLCKYIFGLILLPVERDRKWIINYVEGLYDIMQYFERSPTSFIVYKKFYTLEEGWDKKRTLHASQELHKLSFFKRIQPEVIQEHLPKMKIDIVHKDKLVFCNVDRTSDEVIIDPHYDLHKNYHDHFSHKSIARQTFHQRHVLSTSKRKVYIVIQGWIVAKDHDEDVLLPKTMAKYIAGDIIGAQRIDGGLSNSKEIFFVALADTEVAIMDEDEFYYLWNSQRQKEYEKTIVYLKSSPFFIDMSEQTLYLIVYELLEFKRFEPNTMILAQAKRSPLNLFYKIYYQNMISKIGMKIMKSNEKRMKMINRDMNQEESKSEVSDFISEKNRLRSMSPFFTMHETEQDRQNVAELNSKIPESDLEIFDQNLGVDSDHRTLNMAQNNTIVTQEGENISEFRDQESNGVYIIDKGKWAVVNPFDGYIMSKTSPPKLEIGEKVTSYLLKDEIFGENDIFRINGYQSFGDIISVNQVDWVFLSKDNIRRIPFYELYNIKQNLSNRSNLLRLNYTWSRRYNVKIETVRNY